MKKHRATRASLATVKVDDYTIFLIHLKMEKALRYGSASSPSLLIRSTAQRGTICFLLCQQGSILSMTFVAQAPLNCQVQWSAGILSEIRLARRMAIRQLGRCKVPPACIRIR
jgi:hypothetical protein